VEQPAVAVFAAPCFGVTHEVVAGPGEVNSVIVGAVLLITKAVGPPRRQRRHPARVSTTASTSARLQQTHRLYASVGQRTAGTSVASSVTGRPCPLAVLRTEHDAQ